jgi:hypothetical protein
MMCESCRNLHSHQLVPTPGSPSFCYRCGEPDAVFVEKGFSPATYRICPRCLPDRAARYRAGNFAVPKIVPEEVKTEVPSK